MPSLKVIIDTLRMVNFQSFRVIGFPVGTSRYDGCSSLIVKFSMSEIADELGGKLKTNLVQRLPILQSLKGCIKS